MRNTIFAGFLIVIAPTVVARAQETQVPLDEAGRIQVITSELARKLDLFADVADFREGRLFQASDSSYVLELTAGRQNTLRRYRRPLSAAEVAAFRSDLEERIASRAPHAAMDQSGRTKLLVGSTVLGLGYYGWATAMALDPDDDRSAVAAYMVTAASSFFVPLLATRAQSISDASASLALWGAMRGPLHGYIGSGLAKGESDKTKFGWSVAIGLAEGVGGAIAGRRMTSGRAELTGTGGDIGLGVGFGVSTILGLDRRSRTITVDQFPGSPYSYQVKDRTLESAVMLAGTGAGLAAGYLAGRSEEWSRGDTYILRNVSGLGALAGVAIGDILARPKLVTQSFGTGQTYSYYDDRFSRTHAAAGLVGLAGGVVLGQALVKGHSFTGGQGTLLTLAPVAGGLMGLGIAYLATSENTDSYNYDPNVPYRNPNDHSRLYLGISALGATAAFAALYPALAKQAKGPELAGRFSFTVNPLAFAQLLSNRSGTGAAMLGSVQYRF